MIRGIYTASAALRATTLHQTRLAHNLANLQTTGFKQVLTTHQAYELQRLGEYDVEKAAFVRGVGSLEHGLLVPEEIVDFSQGVLKVTDRPLDLAIEGDAFFRVQTPQGERYTRDGSFHRDGLGRLVTRDGYFVLNAQLQPISLPQGPVTVTGEGHILVGDDLVGQLGLAGFPNGEGLARENGNLYRAEGAAPGPPGNVTVHQGYLEGSNVDEDAQVLEMMRILRLYEASRKTLQIQDQALSGALSVGQV